VFKRLKYNIVTCPELKILKEITPGLDGIDSEDKVVAAEAEAFMWEALHRLIMNRWESVYDDEYGPSLQTEKKVKKKKEKQEREEKNKKREADGESKVEEGETEKKDKKKKEAGGDGKEEKDKTEEQRKKIKKHTSGTGDDEKDQGISAGLLMEEQNEYEQERLARVQANKKRMEELGVMDAAKDLHALATAAAVAAKSGIETKKGHTADRATAGTEAAPEEETTAGEAEAGASLAYAQGFVQVNASKVHHLISITPSVFPVRLCAISGFHKEPNKLLLAFWFCCIACRYRIRNRGRGYDGQGLRSCRNACA